MDRQNIVLDSLKLQEVRHFISVYNEIGSTYLQDNVDLEYESDVQLETQLDTADEVKYRKMRQGQTTLGHFGGSCWLEWE